MKTIFVHRQNRLFSPLLCLFLSFAACKTPEKIVANQPVYRIQFGLLSPSSDPQTNNLIGTVHVSNIDIQQNQPERKTVSLFIHGDGALKAFQQELSRSGLPVIGLAINKVDEIAASLRSSQ